MVHVHKKCSSPGSLQTLTE